jgi:hypothetical protein
MNHKGDNMKSKLFAYTFFVHPFMQIMFSRVDTLEFPFEKFKREPDCDTWEYIDVRKEKMIEAIDELYEQNKPYPEDKK